MPWVGIISDYIFMYPLDIHKVQKCNMTKWSDLP